MKFSTKYQICLHKNYFEKGLSLSNYLKYVIAFGALASQDLKLVLIWAAIYGAFCYILGFIWFKSDFIKAEIEVSNQYNIFVEEMRKKFSYSVKRKV
jgi:hypothetical protein